MAAVAARTGAGDAAGARGMTWRVVVTGPECTGKTTLARAIAARLRAPWVPEAARAYAQARGGVLSEADVEPIAKATRDAMQRALAAGPAVLVADTDLVSTVVYARAYYGSCPHWVEEACRSQLGDLYLLCATDLPWEADGVRDRPDERDRAAMHEAFAATLCVLGARVVPVTGIGPARTARAMDAVLAASPTGSAP
ncbi:MAG: NadR-like protein [Gemmatimonas sp.]|nr:NadR-like protein [Gemmatimonas sp.]